MDGIRINDSESLEAFGVDKQKIVEEITRAYAHQIYVDGFFNGDPHPGTCSYAFLLFTLVVLKICLAFRTSHNTRFTIKDGFLSDNITCCLCNNQFPLSIPNVSWVF